MLVFVARTLVLYFIDNSNGFEILNLLKSFGISLLGTYVSSLLLGFVYVIREHKKINKNKFIVKHHIPLF